MGEMEEGVSSLKGSQGSGTDSLKNAEALYSTVKQAILFAISWLGLNAAPVEAVPIIPFFKRTLQPSVFRVPPSMAYVDELTIKCH